MTFFNLRVDKGESTEMTADTLRKRGANGASPEKVVAKEEKFASMKPSADLSSKSDVALSAAAVCRHTSTWHKVLQTPLEILALGGR